MAGMCFLYPGFVYIADIVKDEKTKCSLEYAFGLCSIGWLPGLEIYPDRRKIYRDRREIHLTAKEYDLLSFLVANKGRVLTY